MALLRVESWHVQYIHRELDDGKFAIPKLQRAFVWNGRKAAALLDSIYRGLPVGAITVWDTSGKNKHFLRETINVLPRYRRQRRIWFVLDGQQRLSVLHRIREPSQLYNAAHKPVDFGRVVFRVTAGTTEPRFAYRRPVDGEYVPLHLVLSPAWHSKLRDLTRGQLARVAECRVRLRDYCLPVVLSTTNDIDAARELFIRINSLGTPLAAADRAFARAAEFDLRQKAEDAWHQLPDAFKNLTDEMLLQTRALLDGITDVGERALQQAVRRWNDRIKKNRKELKRFSKEWDRQQKGLRRAIDLLRHKFGVLDDGLLPSQYMLATLTVFFVKNDGPPTLGQLKQIHRWFWATAVAQRYSGRGFRENIAKDVEWFGRLAVRASTPFSFRERLDPIDLRAAHFNKRSSIADAALCLLISRRPRRLTDGEDMPLEDLASAANKRHKHHVFPRQLLANEGFPAKQAHSILNLCFLSADENTAIGSRRPSQYLRDYADKRHFASAMESHLMPRYEGSGLSVTGVRRGYRQFLAERSAIMISAFEEAAGMKLFRTP